MEGFPEFYDNFKISTNSRFPPFFVLNYFSLSVSSFVVHCSHVLFTALHMKTLLKDTKVAKTSDGSLTFSF